MVAQPGFRPAVDTLCEFPPHLPAMDPAGGRAAAHDGSGRRRKASRSPRRTSSVPASGSPKSDNTEDWLEGKPGQGCSVDELRWFVIQELETIKRRSKAKDKSDYQCRLGVDVIRAAQKALEDKVETLGNDFGKHKTRTTRIWAN